MRDVTPPAGVLLLVEDDPDQAYLVRRRLADHGALGLEVVHLATAAEAAARLAEGDVRCVVVDLSLPDARGMEAVLALRAVDPTVPVVVLTGLDSDAAGLEALKVGAQDYLVKGRHEPDAVARSVRFAMERAQRQAAERRQVLLDHRLQLREAQLSEAQRLARLGSWEWDLSDGEVVWSEELQRITGLRDVGGTGSFERYLHIVAEEDRGDAARLFARPSTTGGPAVVVRHRLVLSDGEVRWVQGRSTVASSDEDGRPLRVVGTVQDIHEQKTAEDRLAHQALHDSLTGLVNRGVLLDRLGRVLLAPRPDGSLVAVLFLDLDQFKWVNDSRSHATGDRLLVRVAAALEGALRPGDTLARFGGDEFVVLCERVRDEEDVLAVVDALAGALELPFPLGDDGDAVLVTASIGIATGRPGTGADPEHLVRDADIAMYRAKERGRARFEIFDEAMRERASARLQTQNDLRTALQRQEVRVHFQPVVDPATGVVLSTEALARWDHPTRGRLLPGDFIPHAEETGLIVPLGAAVLAEACAVTATWNRSRPVPLTVAVNLSARQLSHPDLLPVVAGALRDSGLPPRLLCLEVTETAVMEDAEASARVLAQLRALGVRIAIDDFGTGYSSLAYLLSLPVDVVKVDRSFVAAIDGFGPGTAIVTAVLALAGTLGLDVVAEGVETLEQRDALLELGVRAAQGWLWGRAVAPGEAGWAGAGGRLDAVMPPVVTLPEAREPHRAATSSYAGGAPCPTARA